jgi:hypothetical protein
MMRMQNVVNDIAIIRKKVGAMVHYYEMFGKDLETDQRITLYKACVEVVEQLEDITNIRETNSPHFFTKRLVQQLMRF